MKFQCLNPDCKRTFLHPAKFTVYTGTMVDMDEPYKNDAFETHVCPYCKSLDFEEAVESVPKLVSVVSVAIEEVDGKLKEGYEVKELYAKTATMVKKEATA